MMRMMVQSLFTTSTNATSLSSTQSPYAPSQQRLLLPTASQLEVGGPVTRPQMRQWFQSTEHSVEEKKNTDKNTCTFDIH